MKSAVIEWCKDGYYLHLVMQAKARERLKEEFRNNILGKLEEVETGKEDCQEWLLANCAAAQFYLEVDLTILPRQVFGPL